MNAGDKLHPSWPTPAMRHLGTGHLCLALLSLGGALFVAARWLMRPPAGDLGILVLPAWVAVAAGTTYLATVAAAELHHGLTLRRYAHDREGILPRVVPQLVLMCAMAWAAWLGPVSRSFLVGLGTLLAMAGTIACLSLLLAAGDRSVLRWTVSAAGLNASAPSSSRDRRRQIAARLLALAFAAALVVLESLPLPGPAFSPKSEQRSELQGRSLFPLSGRRVSVFRDGSAVFMADAKVRGDSRPRQRAKGSSRQLQRAADSPPHAPARRRWRRGRFFGPTAAVVGF